MRRQAMGLHRGRHMPYNWPGNYQVVLCLLLLCGVLLAPSEARPSTQFVVTHRRAVFMALSLIQIRCPSMARKFIVQHKADFSQHNLETWAQAILPPHTRKLLGRAAKERTHSQEGLDAEGLHSLLAATDLSRTGEFTYRMWREDAYREALKYVDDACTHAQDDSGEQALVDLGVFEAVAHAPPASHVLDDFDAAMKQHAAPAVLQDSGPETVLLAAICMLVGGIGALGLVHCCCPLCTPRRPTDSQILHYKLSNLRHPVQA